MNVYIANGAICYEAIEVPFSISAISYYFAAACGNNSSLDNNKSSNSDGIRFK